MISIQCSNLCLDEKKYVFDFIFNDVLQISYEIILIKEPRIIINHEKNSICFLSAFLENREKLYDEFGEKEDFSNLLNLNINSSFNDVDAIGAIFYFLTCYAEHGDCRKDIHSRIELDEEFIIKKPIVDYIVRYIALELKILKQVKEDYQLNISCDVDTPYLKNSKFLHLTIKQIIADILKRKSIKQAWLSLKRYIDFKKGSMHLDPYYKGIQLLMDKADSIDKKIMFYFIASPSSGKYDSYYDFNEEVIKKIVKEISHRGHFIGIHGSYSSYNQISIYKQDYEKFRNDISSITGQYPLRNNRQHYLRWDWKKTPLILEKMGIEIDSTLGYSNHIGFRCGTGRQFQMFSLVEKRKLNLIQQPLIFMDVVAKKYFSEDQDKMIDKYRSQLSELKDLDSYFTLLWHNSTLNSNDEIKSFYSVVDQFS